MNTVSPPSIHTSPLPPLPFRLPPFPYLIKKTNFLKINIKHNKIAYNKRKQNH